MYWRDCKDAYRDYDRICEGVYVPLNEALRDLHGVLDKWLAIVQLDENTPAAVQKALEVRAQVMDSRKLELFLNQ